MQHRHDESKVVYRRAKVGRAGRVDRDQRQKEIIESSIRLFYERGYHGTSLDDIGAPIGITGPAINKHFRTKQDLLLAALRRSIEALQDSPIEVEGLPPLEALKMLVARFVEVAIEHRREFDIYRKERGYLTTRARNVLARDFAQVLDVWTKNLCALCPHLSEGEAQAVVHAAIGLVSSTGQYTIAIPRERLAELLEVMALGALLATAQPQQRKPPKVARPAP